MQIETRKLASLRRSVQRLHHLSMCRAFFISTNPLKCSFPSFPLACCLVLFVFALFVFFRFFSFLLCQLSNPDIIFSSAVLRSTVENSRERALSLYVVREYVYPYKYKVVECDSSKDGETLWIKRAEGTRKAHQNGKPC